VPRPMPNDDGEEFAKFSERTTGVLAPVRTYTMGDCYVAVTHRPNVGWHLSISCERRYPTWDEIKAARYLLVPAPVTMAMILPPPGQYVNVEDQDNVFHLHEIPGEETT